eukprot:COSAG06_NODE_20225_length_803_cov_2.259943_1_plen_48_part_10
MQQLHALSARRCPHKLAARTGLTRNSAQVVPPEQRPWHDNEPQVAVLR